MKLRQQDVIKMLVQKWAKSHHEMGGDFGSFTTLIRGALGNLYDVDIEDQIIKVQNYLGVMALRAVPEWANEPLDPQMIDDLERLLED
jgi:hypothetical protein